MLKINIAENTTLQVSSDWDSGKHIGFKAGVFETGEYAGKSLDEVISKSQILEIEALIACRLRAMLRKEGNVFEEFNLATDIDLTINAAKVVESFTNKKE